MQGLDLATFLARAVVLLVAFTIHELAHAVTADWLGDSTPRHMGRITLNPLAHLDPIGTIALLVAGFGWAKPVMVNPYNMRGNPRTSMAIVAAAGPLSNLLMAVLFVLPMRFGLVSMDGFLGNTGGQLMPSLSFLLAQFVWINLILMLFNLIPIPPLDGYKVLTGILPPEMTYRLRPLEQYGFMILLVVVFLVPSVLSVLVMEPATSLLIYLLGF
ncbi:MAG: site-2 protease family protein [Ardenticatenaceae bacterium]|nr:site-2 protease family protein [Anaerolineales bacterium]MCB8922614.1 site-2 protease family protein [Ardenticatenaceae bacterium]MCB8991282.1 site-2 protease family protein [Ardenticatenaceae bacterium]MCB9003677.1 site-2 protease family protein [Ardenticatenaceae bacterium]